MIRAKIRCESKTTTETQNGKNIQIIMRAVTNGSEEK